MHFYTLQTLLSLVSFCLPPYLVPQMTGPLPLEQQAKEEKDTFSGALSPGSREFTKRDARWEDDSRGPGH